jgi:polysaccharide biosynthesis/export protein
MRNKDVLYISNATSVEIAKVLDFVRLITATVDDPIVAAQNAYTLKNLASGVGSAATFNVTPAIP